MQTRDQIMGESLALKELLRNSDYEIIKLAENMTDCTTMAELKACFQTFLTNFGELVQKRRTWRAQVDELQEQLDNLPDDEPEDMPEDMPEEAAEGENTAPDGVSGTEDAPEGGGEIDASDGATDGDSSNGEIPENTPEAGTDTAPEEGNPTDE